jgi:hypothetical protein
VLGVCLGDWGRGGGGRGWGIEWGGACSFVDAFGLISVAILSLVSSILCFHILFRYKSLYSNLYPHNGISLILICVGGGERFLVRGGW